MKKLILLTAVASAAIATPALARDKSWYVEGDAGAMIVEDTTIKATLPGKLDHKAGYDLGGVVGYDFGAFRLESEASFRRAHADGYTINNVRYPQGPSNGGQSALSFMLNGLLDFGPDDGLQGFVGGGAGVSRGKLQAAAPVGANINDSDTGFAWQALAGVRAPLNDKVDLGLKYRFFNQDNINLVDAAGKAVGARMRSHSLLLTLAYNFGAPTPPPPPPPAPVCNKGPYIVFFDWDKSDITPEAATILDSAITAYGNCQSVPIMLAGYADRSGTPKYNVGLSNRRNASVQTYLAGHGVPATAITAQGFGEANPRVPTADGVRELQNRRVEITYGPGSGM